MEHPVFLKDNELQDLKYFVMGDEGAEEYAADDTVESMTDLAVEIEARKGIKPSDVTYIAPQSAEMIALVALLNKSIEDSLRCH